MGPDAAHPMSGQKAEQTKPGHASEPASRRIFHAPPAAVAAAVLLVLITVIAYLPATRCGFIWDDDFYVQNNETLRSLDGLRRIWFEIGATPQYYPLVHTSYWIEYRFWELDPLGYHVVNILLHAVGVVLLWRLLKALEVPGAWAAAAVFALHPVHVESVAWITERKNVLSGVFYLGAALAYVRHARLPAEGAEADRPGKLYAASFGLFACALLGKTVTCTLPAVLLLVLWWKRRRIGWADLRGLVPFFGLGIAFGLLTIWMEVHHVGAEGEEWNLSFVARCLLAGRALCFYVGELFYPRRLTFIYPRWTIDAAAWPQYLYPLAAVGVMASLWFARRRVGRGPLIAVLCFAGTLFPALGFFDVYPMRYSYVADHFQYLASAALIALVTGLVFQAANRRRGWVLGVTTTVFAVVLGTLGTLTWRQTHPYRDLETLWRDTLQKNPETWMAHHNLGNVLLERGALDEAIDHFRHALRINPTYVTSRYNLGLAYELKGQLDEALLHYRRAVQDDPNYAIAQNRLGIVLELRGELDEAAEHYRQAIRVEPRYAKAHSNLGDVLRSQGKLDEAVRQYRQALQIQPDSLPSLNHLAWILATRPDSTSREANEAVRLAVRACELTDFQNPAVLDTLATGYAAAGQFDRAVTTEEAALRSANAAQANELVDQFRERLELFRQGKPYRESARAPGADGPK